MKEDLFKTLVWDNIVRASMQAFFSVFTFLNVPVIRQAVEYIIFILSDIIYKQISLFIELQKIVLKNEIHMRAYTKAILELRRIALEKGENSDDFKIAKAIAMRELASFVGLRLDS